MSLPPPPLSRLALKLYSSIQPLYQYYPTKYLPNKVKITFIYLHISYIIRITFQCSGFEKWIFSGTATRKSFKKNSVRAQQRFLLMNLGNPLKRNQKTRTYFQPLWKLREKETVTFHYSLIICPQRFPNHKKWTPIMRIHVLYIQETSK